MRFVYIVVDPNTLPAMRIGISKEGNLFTRNEGPIAPDTYFTCGDLVLSYTRGSGELLSFSGYLPYFDELPDSDIEMPKDSISARLYVGDLASDFIFAVNHLPLTFSKKNRILHAGEDKSATYIKMSSDVYIGLSRDELTDIYLRISD